MDTDLENPGLVDIPYMIERDNRVCEVNELFSKLTGYEDKDIVGRTVEEVFKQLLRINIGYDSLKHSNECDCYMFDIKRRVKEVTIVYTAAATGLSQNIYAFRQKKNNVFSEKYPFLELANSANDTGVALYSVPDLVLLKANKGHFKYFSKLYSNLEDILGTHIEDLIANWKDSETYDIYMSAVESGQPVFFDEKLIEFSSKGDLYLRYTLTPVFEEGRVKYLILIHNDVTEKVLNRQAIFEKNNIIEEQKNRLESILETISKSVAICIIDKDGCFVGERTW